MNKWSDEETNEPLIADNCNFYKVEKWTKDGSKVDRIRRWRQTNSRGSGEIVDCR